MTFQEFLGTIVANFGSFGIVTWIATAIIVQWQQRKHVELSNDQKRFITIGTALVVVSIAYFVGALLGYWPITLDSLFQAVRPVFAELGGGTVLFSITKAAKSAAEPPPANT